MIIYLIENMVNGKVYIGQTIQSLEKRINNHKFAAKNNKFKSPYLYNAINKYDWINFKISVIEDNIETIEELNKAEIYWIRWYDSTNRDKGYNISLGGDNKNMSQETKDKMSLYHTGLKLSDETKKKISEYRKGRLLSNETKSKITNSLIGKMAGNKHPMFGKKCTKLTVEFINDLILQYANGGITQRELAIKYNLSKSTIWNIVHNKIEGI